MRQLAIHNPFNAPVYHEDTVDSTMNVSRMLAGHGAPHGTVIAADFQESGRGRIRERRWDMERGKNLAFTILLRFPGIEGIVQALTLRTGLAVSLAIEDFAPVLAGQVMIKWPNDILIPAKKAAGILTEADEGSVHIGIGVNVAQEEFPDSLRDKATSLRLASGSGIAGEERYALLEKILIRLHDGLETSADWRSRVEARLYQKGGRVTFINGAADSGKKVTGILTGIGAGGELLITPDCSPEKAPLPFISGELIL
jgi:BirA family biotin operon repressor/biotin-[acetyl-CoA-carboxylase] ligase